MPLLLYGDVDNILRHLFHLEIFCTVQNKSYIDRIWECLKFFFTDLIHRVILFDVFLYLPSKDVVFVYVYINQEVDIDVAGFGYLIAVILPIV